MKKIFLSCIVALTLVFPALKSLVAGDEAAPAEIAIDNFSFKPATLTVPIGTKVTWINRDDVPHTVLSTDKKTIVSPALDTDEKFTFTFTSVGTNDYFCSVHPHMKGRVVVR